MDEIDDMKLELTKKVGEPVGLAYYLNVSLINCLWTIVSGRRLHAQQQVLPSSNMKRLILMIQRSRIELRNYVF